MASILILPQEVFSRQEKEVSLSPACCPCSRSLLPCLCLFAPSSKCPAPLSPDRAASCQLLYSAVLLLICPVASCLPMWVRVCSSACGSVLFPEAFLGSLLLSGEPGAASVCFCFCVALSPPSFSPAPAPALADGVSSFPVPCSGRVGCGGLCDHAVAASHSSPLPVTSGFPFLGSKGPSVHPRRALGGGIHSMGLSPAMTPQHLIGSIQSPFEADEVSPFQSCEEFWLREGSKASTPMRVV